MSLVYQASQCIYACFFYRIGSSGDLDSICTTVRDYDRDYVRLRPRIRDDLMKEILYKVAAAYLTNLSPVKLSLRDTNARFDVANCLKEDARRVTDFFVTVGGCKREVSGVQRQLLTSMVSLVCLSGLASRFRLRCYRRSSRVEGHGVAFTVRHSACEEDWSNEC